MGKSDWSRVFPALLVQKNFHSLVSVNEMKNKVPKCQLREMLKKKQRTLENTELMVEVDGLNHQLLLFKNISH